MAGPAANRYAGGPSPSGLADVLDLILDKGLVVDLYLRVSLVGIELLTVDARIVIASVDTYLRFAEAVGRLTLDPEPEKPGLPQLGAQAIEGVAQSKTESAIDSAAKKVTDFLDR
jgi:hypothetical protein